MDFSIESSLEKIWTSKTKMYFREVISSYVARSYRSAVVMLYSIVICDLIYKLQELQDIYNDSVAESVLGEIRVLQMQNPRSSEWETKLVQLVYEKTNLLEIFDYENIMSLQKHRHLSAHPILNLNYELYNPNRETTRAHIRNMLEGVFIKPAVLSQKVFEEFVKDLSEKRETLIDDEQLRRYLNARYLINMPSEVQKKLFKTLWKFVFRLSNVECNENRDINYRALQILFRSNKHLFVASIKSDRGYFSDIGIGEPVAQLILFLCSESFLYEFLDDAAKALIEAEVSASLEKRILAWYIKSSMQEHIDEIEVILDANNPPNITSFACQAIKNLYDVSVEVNQDEGVLKLMILIFSLSRNFDNADYRYDTLIAPNLDKLSRENLLLLLEKINNNYQIFGRGRSYIANRQIKMVCDSVLGNGFSYEDYPNFLSSIEEE